LRRLHEHLQGIKLSRWRENLLFNSQIDENMEMIGLWHPAC